MMFSSETASIVVVSSIRDPAIAAAVAKVPKLVKPEAALQPLSLQQETHMNLGAVRSQFLLLM